MFLVYSCLICLVSVVVNRVSFKGAQSHFFQLFLKLFEILVSKDVPYFSHNTHEKCYGQKVFPWEDSSENVTSYGNHN